MFRLEQSSGLTSLLNFPDVKIDRVARRTEIAGLRVITSGVTPPNPVELLGSRRMEVVMADLLAAADIVILDTPPTGPVSDAAILSRLVDGVLLVAASRRTRTATLQHAADAVTRASARIIGVVLNAAGPEVGAGYYGYKSEPQAATDVARGAATIRSTDKRNA
jgi:capsular exopolysaccharide synthesis family protein